MVAAIPAEAPGVADFLTRALRAEGGPGPREERISEFGGCFYLLATDPADPHSVLLTLSSPSAPTPEATRAAAGVFEGFARVAEATAGGHVAWKVTVPLTVAAAYERALLCSGL